MAVFPFWRKFLALVTRRYKLTLKDNSITSMGLSVLLETMGQNSNHITDLDLRHNPIGNEGARLLARSLGNNALPNLTRLSVNSCDVGGDGFIALVLALEKNTSLLHLDLCHARGGNDSSEPAFWPWQRVYQRLKRCNELT
jgi:Ran GTPase-activating protein (RanGAP) involved in mRNA processing and transport